jgi:hypothetical protein
MSEKFVSMKKEGETIEVHPSVVENHKQLGWKVVDAEAEAPESPESTPALTPAQIKAAERKAKAEAKKAQAKG